MGFKDKLKHIFSGFEIVKNQSDQIGKPDIIKQVQARDGLSFKDQMDILSGKKSLEDFDKDKKE